MTAPATWKAEAAAAWEPPVPSSSTGGRAAPAQGAATAQSLARAATATVEHARGLPQNLAPPAFSRR